MNHNQTGVNTMTTKKKLGQFYTTNYEYILQDLFIPDNVVRIIEPFAGNGDLLKFIENHQNRRLDRRPYEIECYDIDPKKESIVKRDTLLDPPHFSGAFVITNPPYLARNKSKEKQLFDQYNTNDLYKCFLQILIDTEGCLGGIVIVPLNFFCSIRKNDVELRKHFLEKYTIRMINLFEEQVFEDTKYTTCSFQFETALKTDIPPDFPSEIHCRIYPSKKDLYFRLNSENQYTIGGEIYALPQTDRYRIERATKNTKQKENITNILVKCIDDNIRSQIGLSIVDTAADRYIDETPDLSARSYATLVIDPPIDLEKQKKIVERFNVFFQEKREQYHSLFLTNYRESNTICRKRISFQLVFEIVNYLLLEVDEEGGGA
jgi:hypothetical protein